METVLAAAEDKSSLLQLATATPIGKQLFEKVKSQVPVEVAFDIITLLSIIASLLWLAQWILGSSFVRNFFLRKFIRNQLGVASNEKLVEKIFDEVTTKFEDLSQTDINKLKEEAKLEYKTINT